MRTFGQIHAKLRRQNRKNYTLLVVCNLFSVMLITAFVSMMRSPTVLTILPEGGDSRKQVMAIFVLAVVGCGIFTTYAASLFFRFKSRETGILMALGASVSQLRLQLFKELALIAIGSCLVGNLLGTPLAWCIWQLFRLLLVDTKEMALSFDPQAYLYAGAFSLFTIVTLFIMGSRFIRRTNIIDIVNEQRRTEPIRDVRNWYGPVGIVLILAGGFMGYFAPSVCILVFHWYPSFWINILYLPLFIGLYIVLMHAVVRGWGRGKNRYEHIITHSMMKFQGRQTVRNMLVITVLLAGAYFAAFYTPMLGTSAILETEQRPIDYAFHYRADQRMLTRPDIERMAAEEGVTITSWQETDFVNLGQDGQKFIDDGGGKYHYEYSPLLQGGNYISERNFNLMSGQSIDIQPGQYGAVLAKDGSGDHYISTDTTRLTNMVSRKTLKTSFQGYVYDDMMAAKFYIMDDSDYAAITADLTNEWKEKLIYFNVKHALETYHFAKRLYNGIIDHSGPECEISSYFNRVGNFAAMEVGDPSWQDAKEKDGLSYAARNTLEFKMQWKYAPQFRVLDRSDFMSNFAVFFMLFVFIAIICFAAVLVIGFTRCMTIAINNRQVYDDLKHLGAGPNYLYHSVRGQVSKVFGVPALVGTVMIYVLYVMIMYFNDQLLTPTEMTGLMNCLLVVAGLSTLLWGFYRYTLRKVCKMLNVKKA